MKKFICLIALTITTIINANADNSPQFFSKHITPSASLQKMWIDYDQTVNNEYGMLMHFNFTVYDLQGTTTFLAVYFHYNDASFLMLKDNNGLYKSKTGEVAVSKTFTPSYSSSVYTDMQLFIPYDEFDITEAGTYQLIADARIISPQSETFGFLKQYAFEFTKNENGRGSTIKSKATYHLPTTGPRAVFDSLWIEHNYVKDGQKGMMMHLKFTTYEMKDMDAAVAIYFSYNDAEGKPLKDNNNKFLSGSGNVAVYRDLKPAYPETVYDDLQIFMPNEEFDLAKGGKYKLILDAKLIYAAGGLITYFTYYPFEYSN